MTGAAALITWAALARCLGLLVWLPPGLAGGPTTAPPEAAPPAPTPTTVGPTGEPAAPVEPPPAVPPSPGVSPAAAAPAPAPPSAPLSAAAAASTRAFGVEPEPSGLSIFAGVTAGFGWEEGETNYTHGDPSNGGLFVGAQMALARYLALAVRGGFSTWNSMESSLLGYTRHRLDLGALPSVRLPIGFPTGGPGRPRHYPVWLYLSLPFGVTFPTMSPPERRAIAERIEAQQGWYAGVGAGMEIRLGRWNLFGGLEYTRHSARTVSRLGSLEPGQPTVSERRDHVDHQILMLVGTALGL